jgi:hypothetical protein
MLANMTQVSDVAPGPLVCFIVFIRISNFSAIWWPPPLPVTGLQM